ncbi:MAG: 3,4-dihydroxy-2-butanone-4-phosphate synthase [Phycisphaerales bacterium]
MPDAFSPIPEILDELRAGKMIILTDDEDRENEGDLILPVQFVTPEAVSFMVRRAGGYLFVSLTEETCDRLDLHPQTAVNTSARGTPLMVSIDGHPKLGFTTGVSAFERARTIQMCIDPKTRPDDFVRPGHINPLRARDGGVLVRNGQTEGAIDLCRLAGLTPAAMGIEIMREDGHMARLPDLKTIAKEHNLKICSVASIIEYRLARETLVTRLAPPTRLETLFGPFDAIAYSSAVDPLPHLALTVGGVGHTPGTKHPQPTLVRMHRRHLLNDAFGVGATATHDADLHRAMRALQAEAKAGRGGALVYLRTPWNKTGGGGTPADDLETLLQSSPAASAPVTPPRPDTSHSFGIGCQILRDLGLSRLRLLTNSPPPMTPHGLEAYGIEIVETVGY